MKCAWTNCKRKVIFYQKDTGAALCSYHFKKEIVSRRAIADGISKKEAIKRLLKGGHADGRY